MGAAFGLRPSVLTNKKMTITIPTRRPKRKAVKISLAAVAIFIAKEMIFEFVEYLIF